jgi:hypothetical protein
MGHPSCSSCWWPEEEIASAAGDSLLPLFATQGLSHVNARGARGWEH